MIVLDTNVLSEIMKPTPAPKVVNWMAAQAAADLYTTSITQAEILHGLMLLAPGRRRSALEAAATSMFGEDFAGRIARPGALSVRSACSASDSARSSCARLGSPRIA